MEDPHTRSNDGRHAFTNDNDIISAANNLVPQLFLDEVRELQFSIPVAIEESQRRRKAGGTRPAPTIVSISSLFIAISGSKLVGRINGSKAKNRRTFKCHFVYRRAPP